MQIEDYIYNKITSDPTLQNLLDDGESSFLLYPNVVPKGIDIDHAVTFTLITSGTAYPSIKSANIQFNIFAKTHTKTAEIASALYDLFNGLENQVLVDLGIIYSQRVSESDIGFNYDDGFYQRETTYYFKIR